MGYGSGYDCRKYRNVYYFVKLMNISAMLPDSRIDRRALFIFEQVRWVTLGFTPSYPLIFDSTQWVRVFPYAPSLQKKESDPEKAYHCSPDQRINTIECTAVTGQEVARIFFIRKAFEEAFA